MQVVRKKLSELKLAEINTRHHTERQINEYIRSVEMFGQTKPIVADEYGEVIIGNGLLMALTKMGAEEADCYIVTGLSEVQKKKMMLSDNKIFELGMSLDYVMEDIVKEYKDIDIPGYNEDILNAIVESASETTKTIEQYGTISQKNVDILQKQENNEKRPDPVSLNGSFQQTSEGTPYLQMPTSQENNMVAETEKYITCPHCGAKIRI